MTGPGKSPMSMALARDTSWLSPGTTVPTTIAILLLLGGCAHWFGPADGYLHAVGTTPEEASCELSLASVGAVAALDRRVVSGSFRESFVIGHSRKGHRIELSCDGTVVSERTFKYGRDVRIGGDLRVTGRVP